MHFEKYDPVTGNNLEPVSDLNFGDVFRGQHCSFPLLLRGTLDEETSITDFKLFLESKDGWSSAEYGYYINSNFVASVEAGSSTMSNHFTEVPGADQSSSGSVPIGWTGNYSDYIWLDVDISPTQKGSSQPNFRAFFNYT